MSNTNKLESSPLLPTLSLNELEKIAMKQALRVCAGSTSKAAKVLECSVRKLQYRLRSWGLKASQFAPGAIYGMSTEAYQAMKNIGQNLATEATINNTERQPAAA